MIFASGGRIATTGIDLAVCRDWILVIASESNSATHGASGSGDGRLNALLTFLTTSLRRITLICKLLSPLLISLLTTTLGYRSTTALLVAFTVITLISEMVWIRVVWRKFEVLEQAEVLRQARRDMEESATRGQAGIEVEDGPRGALLQNASRACHFLEDDSDSGHQRRRVTEQRQPQRRLLDSAVRALVPWNEFRKMPIFLSQYRFHRARVLEARADLACRLSAYRLYFHVSQHHNSVARSTRLTLLILVDPAYISPPSALTPS